MRYIDGDFDSVQHIAILEYEYLGSGPNCQAYASNGWVWIFLVFQDMLLLVLHMNEKKMPFKKLFK